MNFQINVVRASYDVKNLRVGRTTGHIGRLRNTNPALEMKCEEVPF